MAITSFAGRCRWQMRALGSNPLIRASDRLEALAVLAAIVIALFAVPVAAQAGTQIYDTGVRAAHEQSLDRHSVTATAVESSTSMPTDFDSSASVRVQWREGALLRSEQTITPSTVKAGESLKIWLDRTGKVVAAPLTAADAKLSALGTAGTVWVVIAVCGVVMAVVVRRRLDRARDRAWERELHLMAHNDDGWANRHI